MKRQIIYFLSRTNLACKRKKNMSVSSAKLKMWLEIHPVAIWMEWLCHLWMVHSLKLIFEVKISKLAFFFLLIGARMVQQVVLFSKLTFSQGVNFSKIHCWNWWLTSIFYSDVYSYLSRNESLAELIWTSGVNTTRNGLYYQKNFSF